MNLKIFLLLIFLITIKIGKSQCFSTCIELASINPNNNDDDLKKLDSYFKNVRVVGMGESTHGTHEFFIMRHRIFKYLVEYHGFNTFFLEADYANCLRINNYIHGKEDNIIDVVNGIGMWPWITQEMADLINWMREYNSRNLENQLNFIGVDMQRYTSTTKSINRLINKYNLTIDTTINIDDKSFMVIGKNELSGFTKKLNDYQNLNIEELSKDDKNEYKTLIIHLSQIIEEKHNKKDYFFRDKKMGENILFHLESDTTIKGFFWGHNAHINKWAKSKNEKTKKWIGFAGGYLKNALGEKYLSIGQDFDEGSFNTYYLDSNSTNIIGGKGYTLGSITVPLSSKGSFSALYRNSQTPLFIDFSDFQDNYTESKKYFIMHSIGALYIPRKQKTGEIQWGLYTYTRLKSFDAVILIKNSTPTNLLKIDDTNR